MNPQYRFFLTDGNTTRQSFPNFGEDLALDYAREQGEQFYRGQLSGKLTFQADDYAFIVGSAFDTRFGLTIEISRDGGATWTTYWKGRFWKTDCEFDGDAKTVSVTPSLADKYDAVLAGMDKEFDLLSLKPVIRPIKLDKRAMLQIYLAGSTSIGCFLSGIWWEQECEAVSNDSTLQNTYKFAQIMTKREVTTTGGIAPFEDHPIVPKIFCGDPFNYLINGTHSFDNGYWRFTYTRDNGASLWAIVYIPSNTTMWAYMQQGGSIPSSVTLAPLPASGSSDSITISFEDKRIYARVVCDVDSIDGTNTSDLPSPDITPENRNYHKVLPWVYANGWVYTSIESSVYPTEWGLNTDDEYYMPPASSSLPVGIGTLYPIGRGGWGMVSYWFAVKGYFSLLDESARKEATLRNAYPLWSVISVLLGKIGAGVSHQGNTDYSQFLYGENPLTSVQQELFLTPKSNIINANYDQPAQKAPITLRQVLDMLRDCFRCYWWIDASGKFRIEHIAWFMRGETYQSGEPEVGINLTEQIVTRNGKPWSYARNQYTFEKPDMPERYQFGWMDEATNLFEGYPIEILSSFVEQGNVENIQISHFSTDLDYILLNPSEISKDGFVILSTEKTGNEYKVLYREFEEDDTEYRLQNGYLAFNYLQLFYLYDLPAPSYSIDGEVGVAPGTKKLKTQTLRFPVLIEPDFMELVKTSLGDGIIEKMSINLLSRNANTTLRYDTE